MFDNYIFVKPGFLRGAARALDIGGHLGREAFFVSDSPRAADANAIRSDWRAVGEDVAKAMASVGAELETAK